MRYLGEAAREQLRKQGYDVDGQLRKEQAAANRKSGRSSPEFLRRDSKYGVSAKDMRTLDGICFDSKFEMNAYRMMRDGEVTFDRQVEFVLQPRFEADGKVIRPIKYEVDFLVYALDGKRYLVDTKGVTTREFLLKQKMMLAQGHRVHCIKTLGALMVFLMEHDCYPQPGDGKINRDEIIGRGASQGGANPGA